MVTITHGEARPEGHARDRMRLRPETRDIERIAVGAPIRERPWHISWHYSVQQSRRLEHCRINKDFREIPIQVLSISNNINYLQLFASTMYYLVENYHPSSVYARNTSKTFISSKQIWRRKQRKKRKHRSDGLPTSRLGSQI